jgi:hypothetical protein
MFWKAPHPDEIEKVFGPCFRDKPKDTMDKDKQALEVLKWLLGII